MANQEQETAMLDDQIEPRNPLDVAAESAMLDQPVSHISAGKAELLSELSDRQLLEYIARNMITTEQVIKTVEANIPLWLKTVQEFVEQNPTLKTILRFLPKDKS